MPSDCVTQGLGFRVKLLSSWLVTFVQHFYLIMGKVIFLGFMAGQEKAEGRANTLQRALARLCHSWPVITLHQTDSDCHDYWRCRGGHVRLLTTELSLKSTALDRQDCHAIFFVKIENKIR